MSNPTALPSPIRAEVRAVEEGHRAFVQADGSNRVISDSRDGVAYRVTFSGFAPDPVAFRCDCPAGVHRSGEQIVCKHQALAARRLEREGLAVWRCGVWWSTLAQPRLVAAPVNVSALVD